VIRRRFAASLRNLPTFYRPIADTWEVFDNSGFQPRSIAFGRMAESVTVLDTGAWKALIGDER
jgi:predicted ABC-type ATPase